MKYPKAILFDFDGVIVDSFDAHYEAWKSAFFKLFNTQIPDFPHHTHTGKSPMLIAKYFCEKINKADNINANLECFRKSILKVSNLNIICSSYFLNS